MQDLQSFALDISETISNEIDNSETKIRKINAPGYGQVTAVSINLSDENLATNIYLNDYFDDYIEGKDPEEVAEDIAYRYKNELNIGQEVSFSLLNFDEVKNFIVPVMYADIPYNETYTEGLSKEIAKDLRVYYVIFDEEASKKYIINDSLLDKWGIDLDELHDLAMSNIDNVINPEIVPMTVLLAKMSGVDIEDIPEEHLQTDELIIQSSRFSLGAVGILSEKIQDELAEFYGENFYIIPSSTHELICTSKDKDIDELTTMLQSINETEIAPDEILGNHIFAFDTEEMKLCHGNDIKPNKLMFTKQSMVHDKAVKDSKEVKGKSKEESL